MAASRDNVAFVLVSGSFSGPWMYDRVKSLLVTAPYSLPSSAFHDVPLLSATPSRPEGPATMYDDASAIATTISALAEEGKQVILTMSSYGGFPGTEAAHRLSQAARAKEGLKGGIISLVYIAAFIPKVGQCVKELTGGMPGEDEYMSLEYSPEFAHAIFMDLSSPEEQKKYFNMMSNQSRVSFDGQLKHEGWKGVKSYYLHTKNDMVIPPQLQMEMIEKAKEGGADLEVVEFTGSHVPMIGTRESEETVAELLVRAAGL